MAHLDLSQVLHELLGLLVLCTHLHYLLNSRAFPDLGSQSVPPLVAYAEVSVNCRESAIAQSLCS